MPRNSFALFAAICLFSCSQKAEKQTRFVQYFNILPDMELPLYTNSHVDLIGSRVNEDTSFVEFKKDVFSIWGKQKINDSVYAIVSLYPGDNVLPILKTYDIRGKEISILHLLNIPGGSSGYDETGASHLEMDKQFNITITDSVETFIRDTSVYESPVMEGSIKKSVIAKKYKVLTDGMITEIH